jgi:hypothetical protein
MNPRRTFQLPKPPCHALHVSISARRSWPKRQKPGFGARFGPLFDAIGRPKRRGAARDSLQAALGFPPGLAPGYPSSLPVHHGGQPER